MGGIGRFAGAAASYQMRNLLVPLLVLTCMPAVAADICVGLIRPLTFGPGTTLLNVRDWRQLQTNAECLRRTPSRLVVLGHTAANETKDSGSALELGMRRAQKVVKLLNERSVDRNQMTAASAGSEAPQCSSNRSRDCQAKNSFVNLVIQTEQAMPATLAAVPDNCLQLSAAAVYFPFVSTALGDVARAQLDRLAACLLHTGAKVAIQGHADDWEGNSVQAMGWGEVRAEHVRAYLLTKQVEPTQLPPISYGKERPVSFNCTSDEACPANRRVDFSPL